MGRRRERGTAAVEMVMGALFLFVFAAIAFDFMRGYSAQMSAELAARQAAWAHGRALDAQVRYQSTTVGPINLGSAGGLQRSTGGYHPRPPDPAVRAPWANPGIHYLRTRGAITAEIRRERVPSVVFDLLRSLQSGAGGLAGSVGGGPSIGGENLGSLTPSGIGGRVWDALAGLIGSDNVPIPGFSGFGALGSVFSPVTQALQAIFRFFDRELNALGGTGAAAFFLGEIDLSIADVHQEPEGVLTYNLWNALAAEQVADPRKRFRAFCYVSLRTGHEAEPQHPWGWYDPVDAFFDVIFLPVRIVRGLFDLVLSVIRVDPGPLFNSILPVSDPNWRWDE